ncbi:MAG: 4Fe-4S binding protein, partial [Candidatus Hodarchaeales archaeon]
MNDETELKGPVLPLGRPTVGSAGETGDWRTIRPVFIEENCIKCYKCWLSCPEGTIR